MKIDIYEKLRELEERIKALEKQVISPKVDEEDSLFYTALDLIKDYKQVSASLLQRRLAIGYARACRILDQLESKGVVSKGEGSNPRKVLMDED